MAHVVFPTLVQVRDLPKIITAVIPPEYEDLNGHVNVQHYLGIYNDAGWPFFALLGLDETYITEQRKGIFDLEHHLFYLAELHVGDAITVYARFLGRTAKRLHGLWFIVNETRDQLSNTFEFITAHADLDTRRTSPFPEDVATRLDDLIAKDQALDWSAPVCGVMAP